MANQAKIREVLSYIKTPLSPDSIRMLYNANNVKYDKCEMFGDFVQSLLCIVFDTYMGDDITNDEQRADHFKWCWDKNIINFKAEGIEFNATARIYKYYLNFMLEFYYSTENKGDENITIKIKKIWANIFSFGSIKTRSDVDAFLEIYGLMDKSL